MRKETKKNPSIFQLSKSRKMDLGRKTHVRWAQSSVINIAGEDNKCVQTGDECGHTCLAQARSSCQGVLHTRAPQSPCVRLRDGQTSLFASDTLQKIKFFKALSAATME